MGNTVRIPSEQDTTRSFFAGSNDPNEVAWFIENSSGTTQPVGQKSPNGFGLYDMSGNVFEWCGII